jgi:hypothetical protein
MSDALAVFFRIGRQQFATHTADGASTYFTPKRTTFQKQKSLCIILDLDFFNKLG